MAEGNSFQSIDQVIDFAIEREREAQDLYLSYLKATGRAGFRQLLLSMVEMEREHEKKLLELKQGKNLEQVYSPGSARDLRIGDYLVDLAYSPDMDYGDFLVLVIKKEGKAEELYLKLEALASEPDVKQTFQVLATEEKKHRMWAQDRYDLEILKEG